MTAWAALVANPLPQKAGAKPYLWLFIRILFFLTLKKSKNTKLPLLFKTVQPMPQDFPVKSLTFTPQGQTLSRRWSWESLGGIPHSCVSTPLNRVHGIQAHQLSILLALDDLHPVFRFSADGGLGIRPQSNRKVSHWRQVVVVLPARFYLPVDGGLYLGIRPLMCRPIWAEAHKTKFG
ncbi:hypothetical protein B0H10DRAFT_2388266, partial [Mycena sp. CBHHK59/15]